MRGKRAKQIRGLVYGLDNSPRYRKYYKAVTLPNGRRRNGYFADDLRRKYQGLKRIVTRARIRNNEIRLA